MVHYIDTFLRHGRGADRSSRQVYRGLLDKLPKQFQNLEYRGWTGWNIDFRTGVPSEDSIVTSNTDLAKNFLSDTQSTHLNRWWENGEALNIVACQIRGAIAMEQLGCEVGARGLDENGR